MDTTVLGNGTIILRFLGPNLPFSRDGHSTRIDLTRVVQNHCLGWLNLTRVVDVSTWVLGPVTSTRSPDFKWLEFQSQVPSFCCLLFLNFKIHRNVNDLFFFVREGREGGTQRKPLTHDSKTHNSKLDILLMSNHNEHALWLISRGISLSLSQCAFPLILTPHQFLLDSICNLHFQQFHYQFCVPWCWNLGSIS